MKKILEFVNVDVAKAAVEDASNFGLTALFETVDEKPTLSFESKASLCCEAPATPSIEDFKNFVSYVNSELEYRLKWMREDLAYASQRFNQHMEGHLPPIKDAGKLQAAINTLGMGDSYEVKKATVYVQY